MSRMTTMLATCLLVGGVWLAMAGGAGAAPGQIAYDGCLANTAAEGCVDLPFSPLSGANGVAVSPDDKSVYVASYGADSIGHFFRGGPAGQIAWDGCLNNEGSQNCGDLPGAPLEDAEAVAASPDGQSVYVVSSAADTIARFSRAGPDGQITYGGCLNNDGSQGCIDLPFAPLDGASAVAVSPDGRSVYVTSYLSDSVSHFFRGLDGRLEWDGCLSNDGSQNCGDLPFAPIDGPVGVAVSPDSRSVYVTALLGDAIAHFFSSGPEGQLAWDGCLNNDGSQNCRDLPFAPLDAASGVAVSPDGRSVYVAAVGGDSIAHLFATGPQGQISWDGCLNNDGSQNCGDLPGAPLDGARAVATSRDGRSVYVASQNSHSIAHLLRSGPDGQITYDGCLANDPSRGCRDLPFAPLFGAQSVAVSPDGRSVYVASDGSSSVASFAREPAPPRRSPGGAPGSGAGSGGSSRAFGSKTLVKLALAAKRIPARAPVKVRVTNANGFPVTGNVAGQARARRIKLPGKRFGVDARAKRIVALKLPRALRKRLVRTRSLTLRLTARVNDPAGHTRTVKKTVKPKLTRTRGR